MVEELQSTLGDLEYLEQYEQDLNREEENMEEEEEENE